MVSAQRKRYHIYVYFGSKASYLSVLVLKLIFFFFRRRGTPLPSYAVFRYHSLIILLQFFFSYTAFRLDDYIQSRAHFSSSSVRLSRFCAGGIRLGRGREWCRWCRADLSTHYDILSHRHPFHVSRIERCIRFPLRITF